VVAGQGVVATWRKLSIALLASMALLLGAHAAYIPAKAMLAQWLLAWSWQQGASDGEARRPWPWADTYPVARLQVPRLGIDQIVLQGASGRVIAFGPGWVDGTASPGERGNTVISGHRDTHFRWLSELRVDERILLQLPDGRSHRFRITSLDVVNDSDTWLLAPDLDDRLRLVTCYPFDAVQAGASQRYVVTADRERLEAL
jgi:sortase A